MWHYKGGRLTVLTISVSGDLKGRDWGEYNGSTSPPNNSIGQIDFLPFCSNLSSPFRSVNTARVEDRGKGAMHDVVSLI